jgi:hypothetical protein
MAVDEAYGIAPGCSTMTGSPGRWMRSPHSWTRLPAVAAFRGHRGRPDAPPERSPAGHSRAGAVVRRGHEPVLVHHGRADNVALAAARIGVSLALTGRLLDSMGAVPAIGFGSDLFVAGHVLGLVLIGIALWRGRVLPTWGPADNRLAGSALHLRGHRAGAGPRRPGLGSGRRGFRRRRPDPGSQPGRRLIHIHPNREGLADRVTAGQHLSGAVSLALPGTDPGPGLGTPGEAN